MPAPTAVPSSAAPPNPVYNLALKTLSIERQRLNALLQASNNLAKEVEQTPVYLHTAVAKHDDNVIRNVLSNLADDYEEAIDDLDKAIEDLKEKARLSANMPRE